MAEVSLEAAVIIVAWFVSLAVAILVVPRLAGKKSEDRLTGFLQSEKAEPLWDKAAERIMVRMEPRFKGFEERMDQPVQIDFKPIVGMVAESVAPRVREEVDKVRAVIDGKMGWFNKIGKGVGETVAETVGEQALEAAGADPAQAELLGYMDNLLNDKEWTKEHPAAALGLRILKRSGGGNGTAGLQLTRGSAPGQKGLMRLRK